MASTIKLKNGSGAPLNTDLVTAEPALDLTNKRLYTEDSGGNVIEVGTNPAAEITANAGIALPDSQKATFGAGDDLQIYHDGSHSYIKDSGTGDLRFLATNLIVNNGGDTQNMFKAIDGGAVTAYYNGSAKLATTNTGIDVTGTVTADGLTLNDASTDVQINSSNTNARLDFIASRTSSNLSSFRFKDNADRNKINIDQSGDISFYEDTGTTAKFFWDAADESLYVGDLLSSGNSASGNIGITTEATTKLHVKGRYRGFGITNFDSTIAVDSDYPRIMFGNSEGSGAFALIGGSSADNSLSFYTTGTAAQNGTISLSERMRIDSSGNVGIGTTSPVSVLTAQNSGSLTLDSNDGDHTGFGLFIKAPGTINTVNSAIGFGSTGGRKLAAIGYQTYGDADIAGLNFYVQPSALGSSASLTEAMRIDSSGNLLVNCTSAKTQGTAVSGGNPILQVEGDIVPSIWAGLTGHSDLGDSTYNYEDAYVRDGVTTTSDRNEKQDIEELSEAEQRVAVAVKSLLRKYRWISSVAEKGDDARIHFGIIAQDLQAAFEAEGLDAGRYAMFMSNTWWEAEETYTNDEGVEQTRINTYKTAEEAPEGATERTRLGVRYSELLAFIIAAI